VTKEEGRVRGHPVLSKQGADPGNGLSTKVKPPPVPRMSSELAWEGRLALKRELSILSGVDWEEVADAFYLVGSDLTITINGVELLLPWPNFAVQVRFVGELVPR